VKTRTDLDFLTALRAKGTEGKWEVVNNFDPTQRQIAHPGGFIANTLHGNDVANADLIVGAVNALDGLIAELREAREIMWSLGCQARVAYDEGEEVYRCAICRGKQNGRTLLLDPLFAHTEDCAWLRSQAAVKP